MSELRYLCFSKAMARLPGLDQVLQAEISYAMAAVTRPDCSAVVTWGRKSTAARAEFWARRWHLPLIRVEDGFLRSAGDGQTQPLSMVVDRVGIYYDASQASELEQLISNSLTEAQQQRALELQQLWRDYRLTKYNHLPEVQTTQRPYVLVIDQTRNDASVRYGGACAASFSQMLYKARQLFPEHQIRVKVHPDVVSGKKAGYLDLAQVAQLPDTVLDAIPCHAPSLLEHADAVFTVTSQVGFEALLWGKAVYCFGMPFYAGWGLTHDEQQASVRRKPVSLLQLIYACLIAYPRYLDPIKLQLCEPEQVFGYFAAIRQSEPDQRYSGAVQAYQVPLWKKPLLKQFWPQLSWRFVSQPVQLEQQKAVFVWGRKNVPGAERVVRVEDGFIRSVGLGAELRQPVSWVFDDEGIYYDATCSSAVERCLNSLQLTEQQQQRAEALIKALVDFRLSKYNLKGKAWQRPERSIRVVLVPGQVETDASIALGAVQIKTNTELLSAVRSKCPDAYIVFKPHPDEVAGLRVKSANASAWQLYADEVITDADLPAMLDLVDEVHVNTSLTGFEALLRGRKVVCYGLPFYAGWGLTEDVNQCARRGRKLQLPELVYGCLILYPRYLSPRTGQLCEPEQAVRELYELSQQATKPWWQSVRRALVRAIVGAN